MPITAAQCGAFNDYLGRRPYDWDKKISKDRKPASYLYAGMYKSESWASFTGTTHLHERVYVTRPNDPGLWTQFVADPCVGTPCDVPRQMISHGVDQLRYDRYKREYQSEVFCLDQLNTVEEALAKLAAVVEGYKELPEIICSDFYRLLVLRKAGTNATQSGLFLAGLQDGYGNPLALDVSDNMFTLAQGQSLVQSNNVLLINLNANGGLTAALGQTATTALLSTSMGKLTMEYLGNIQVDLAANGYHDREWLEAGKFSITTDANTRRNLLVANPALADMYKSADFVKGGAFYSYGVTDGCGDWLFKEDKEQMRFRFRSDLDGKDFSGNALAGAVWIEQVWPYVNASATYGNKPVFSPTWKNAPLRLYHVYNREARQQLVGDITSVNSDMKFGMARSFMGKWTWKSPVAFQGTDPNTGLNCTFYNDKGNKGYFLGEFDLGLKTVYPEIERVILALGEAQPFLKVPRTNTAPLSPVSSSDYQNVLAYSAQCYDPGSNTGGGFPYPPED